MPNTRSIDCAAGSTHAEGQSVIELAFLLPVLLLMLAGIVDLGRAFEVHSILTNAAREGAHLGTFSPSDLSAIRSRVTNTTAGTGVTFSSPGSCPDICITYPSGNASGNPIQVQVQYQYNTIVGSILGLSSLTIQATNQAIIF